MAITNAQQSRQMYNKGSKKPVTQAGVKNFLGKQEMVTAPKFWLSDPAHVKAKLAYITDEEEKILIDKNLYGSLKGKPNKGPAGLPSLQGGDFGAGGGGGNTGGGNGDKGSSNREKGIMSRGKGPKGTTGNIGDFEATGPDRSKVGQFSTYGKNVMAKNLKGPNLLSKIGSGIKNYITSGGLIGMGIKGVSNLFGGPKSFTDKYGYSTDYQGTKGPSSVDDDDDDRGGDGMALYARLGYPSQQAYMAAMQLARPSAGLPAAVQPQQTMDLNRIAYRFMADGGFLDDEIDERQAYGLGSIVRKITRPIKKVVKKATKAVKKVTKSPFGRLALAVAAPYALGPAMANAGFLQGLSAASRAALISGATTGVTQLASGEDLDLKDIALSAALSGGISKFTTPAGGIDGKAFAANRASAAPKFQLPRGGGADFSQIAASSTRPNMFDIAGPATKPSTFTQFTKDVLNPRGIPQVAKDPSLFSSITQNLGKFGSKAKDLLIMNKDGTGVSPLKLAGLAGLAGLATAKGIEQEEAEEMDRGPGIDIAAIRRRPFDYFAPRFAGSEFDFYAAEGGQAKKEPVAKKVMPLLDMGGMEKDYRAEGGFVPIGRMEKADDVPARLSKNEFVFTADAVRNAGDGDVDKGAEVMYNMMKNLEAGGDVSEESQGLEGARRMFQTSQRLEEVL